jgi:outer membrane protein insertion porin family
LNSQFPQAAYNGRALIAKGTQNVRSSTGVELQVIMPVVNAPFRIYWAYNPLRADTIIQPPVAADRSYFPNQASYLNAMYNPSTGGYGLARPYVDPKKTFRFTIGRTF